MEAKKARGRQRECEAVQYPSNYVSSTSNISIAKANLNDTNHRPLQTDTNSVTIHCADPRDEGEKDRQLEVVGFERVLVGLVVLCTVSLKRAKSLDRQLRVCISSLLPLLGEQSACSTDACLQSVSLKRSATFSVELWRLSNSKSLLHLFI